jgi:uncharacterized integral membrane protein
MFSIQFKLLIIALFLGSLAIFVLQNTQTISLVLFGSTIATLPVGIAILLSICAGIITSFILQIINQSRVRKYPQVYPESPNRNTFNYPPKNRVKPDSRSSFKPEIKPVQKNDNYDEPKNLKDSPKTQIQNNITKPVSDTESIENQENLTKKDTIYSYSYPKNKPKDINKTDNVYDANYRVIVPPYQQNEDQSLDDENEEDWV